MKEYIEQKKDPMNLVFTCEDSFSQHLGVLLCSLFGNKKAGTQIGTIFIISNGISEQNKKKLLRLTRRYHFSGIRFIAADQDLYKNYMLDQYVSHHSTYYKISIPDLIDANIDKVLYLDCDIVVCEDLSDLWNTDITEYYLAAVPDWFAEEKQRVYIAKKGEYFNSGVMLMNLKKWRQENISSQILRFLDQNNDRVVFREQDGINAVVYKKYFPLAPKYNQIFLFWDVPIEKTTFNAEELALAINKPVIVHYAGPKPWNYGCTHPYRMVYYRYLFRTPWRFFVPNGYTYKDIKYRFLNKHQTLFGFLRKTKRGLFRMIHKKTEQ